MNAFHILIFLLACLEVQFASGVRVESHTFSFSSGTDIDYHPLDEDYIFQYTQGSSFFLNLVGKSSVSPDPATNTTEVARMEYPKDVRLRLVFCPPRKIFRKPSFLLHGKGDIGHEIELDEFCEEGETEGARYVDEKETGKTRSCQLRNIKTFKTYFLVEEDWGRYLVGVVKCSKSARVRTWIYNGNIRSSGPANSSGSPLGRDEMVLAISTWVTSALYLLALFIIVVGLIYRLRISRIEEQEGIAKLRIFVALCLALKVLSVAFLSAFWVVYWVAGIRKGAIVNLRVPILVCADLTVVALALLSCRGDGVLEAPDRPIGKLQVAFVIAALSSYVVATLIFALSAASYVSTGFYFLSAAAATCYVITQAMRNKVTLLNHLNRIRDFGVLPKSTPYYLRMKFFSRLPYFVATCFFARAGAVLVIDHIIDVPRPWLLFIFMEMIDFLIISGLSFVFFTSRYSSLYLKIPVTFATRVGNEAANQTPREQEGGGSNLPNERARDGTSTEAHEDAPNADSQVASSETMENGGILEGAVGESLESLRDSDVEVNENEVSAENSTTSAPERVNSTELRVWEPGSPLPPIARYDSDGLIIDPRIVNDVRRRHRFPRSFFVDDGSRIVSETSEDGKRRMLHIAIPVSDVSRETRIHATSSVSVRKIMEATTAQRPRDERTDNASPQVYQTPDGSEEGLIFRASQER